MRRVQQQTWDSVQVEGVETIYYIGGGNDKQLTRINDSSQEMILPCSDEYNMMHYKFKMALMNVNWNEFDFVFKTNSSSYINKRLLLEFAEKLPNKKCYCGISGGTFASGCGVFFSHDCIEILLKHYDDYPSPSEDGLTGSYLSQHGIGITEGAQRMDICNQASYYAMENKCYHYRCKHDHNRSMDMNIMRRLFDIHEKPSNAT